MKDELSYCVGMEMAYQSERNGITRIPEQTHCGLLQTVSTQSHTTIMCKCQCQMRKSQISNKLSHCAVFSN